MQKSFYNSTQKLLLKFRSAGKVKQCAYSNYLKSHYCFGEERNGYIEFNADQRAKLIRDVKADTKLDLLFDSYPEEKSRLETADAERNEKANAYPVTRDYVLINSLHHIKLNQQTHQISAFTALGLTVNADHIVSVEHAKIVFVENLEIMAVLAKLNIPDELKDALWLYRGDLKKDRHTAKAYQFFRRFKDSHQLIYFGDLDPAGIEIALTCGAHYWLTPEDSAVINMKLDGDENEWDKQGRTITSLRNKSDLPEKCRIAFQEMSNKRKTLKQEHMLTHNIQMGLYKLTLTTADKNY